MRAANDPSEPDPKDEGQKPKSHTALRKTEGSMIKHDLNISANSLHIKWPVLDASVSNFSSERDVSSSSQYVQKIP